MRFLALAVSVLTLLPSTASACEYSRGPIFKLLEEWKTSCKHPLCGQIHIADASRLTPAAAACDAKGWVAMKTDLRDTIVKGGVVLFGEVHDNPLHHDLRSRSGMSNFPSIVFEQISTDKSAALEEFRKVLGNTYKDTSLADFKKAIGYDESGWSKYKYDDLFTSVLKARAPIYAGDAPREQIKKIAQEGDAAVSAEDKARLKLDTAMGEKLDEASRAEIAEAHCNMLPKEALPNMALAQRYRDAILADSVLKAFGKHGAALLITGNGHLRKDRGVPWFVRARAPDKLSLSIALIEVEEGKSDAEAYVARDPDGKPAVDYIIFTPRAERGDNCAEMKAKSPG